MRLKSFTTYGFKSFADKTELTFDRGITAIVGPNGSGKSNVSDAIRWVLGEQSAKYLRGSKMEDVIFSGSSKRRALGVAEVTLIFDNQDQSLPLDFTEVSLTRRIFRSGESEYAINRKNCRLKDIVDLMADTGLGKGSMSIIGQNKIDEILNSRPEDRRMIFEEAAGIAKYRLRKKEALRRLEDTGNNLTRINDIKIEVDKQVEPLQEAAAKTLRHNELQQELRQCTLTSLMQKLQGMEQVRSRLLAQKAELEAAYSQELVQLSQKEAQASAIQLKLDQLGEGYSKLQDEIRDQETAIEKLRGSQAVLEERKQQNRKAQERLTKQNGKLEEQSQGLEAKLQELVAEFDTLDKQRLAAEIKARQLAEAKTAQEAVLHQVQEENSTLQASFFTDLQKLLELRNSLQGLERMQEERVRQREELKQQLQEQETEQAQREQDYQQVLGEKARNDHEGQRLADELAELQRQLNQAEEELKSLHAKQLQYQAQLTTATTREESLRKLQQAYEGFDHGTRSILTSRESWRPRIIGVAAELLSMDPLYVTAMEVALGGGAQNLLTEDAATAKAAINYLKQHKLGRATFLPLDIVRPRQLSEAEQQLAKEPGVCGWAVDLVSYEPRLANAISFLLGHILIVEDMDVALAVAKRAKYKFNLVTLEGELLKAGGSLTGGSRRQKEGYLSRQREIDQAVAQAEEWHGKLLSLQEQVEAVEADQSRLTQKLQQTVEQVQQKKLLANSLLIKADHLHKEQLAAGAQLEELLNKRTELAQAYLAQRDEVKALREQLQQRESQDVAAKEALQQLKQRVAQENSKLAAVANQLRDAQLEQETSAAKTGYVSDSIRNLDEENLRLRKELTANQEEAAHLVQELQQCDEEQLQGRQELERQLAQLQQTVGGRQRYLEQKSGLQEELQQAEEAVQEARHSSSLSEGRVRNVDLELSRQNSDYDHAREQLTSVYQLTEEEAAAEELLDLDAPALQRREKQLQQEITVLGPVNPAALEEYQAVKERSEFLNQQYDDLCRAKENLETVIGQINTGMTKKFKEAFQQINGYFAGCYQKLFGGGTAVLKLADPEDILHSGINIEVQPPGKKLQSLYLMSGGERALTVIALLFALLSYQPAPFCILDEIDAALDDANIVRFSNFLRDYARDTQFIIITHRKGTMECADTMYGITMEESGVSKLLSVKISTKE